MPNMNMTYLINLKKAEHRNNKLFVYCFRYWLTYSPIFSFLLSVRYKVRQTGVNQNKQKRQSVRTVSINTTNFFNFGHSMLIIFAAQKCCHGFLGSFWRICRLYQLHHISQHSTQLTFGSRLTHCGAETIKNIAFEPVTFILLRPLIWENYCDIWVFFSRQKSMTAFSTL